MSIFILEDDILQAQNMKKLIEEICMEQQIPYDFIETTSRPDQLLSKIPFTRMVPIFFLDIEIKSETRKGLHVAQEIRKLDSHGIIVFVTTHSELAPISYQYMVSALTFIDKGLGYHQRVALIGQCLQHYASKNRSQAPEDDFVVDHAQATVRVPFSTLEYIMTDGPHRLCLVTEKQVIHFYGTLKEIEALDERLFRCHQSYLVNQTQIQTYDSRQKVILLRSGKAIPVSRRLAAKVKSLIKEV